MMMLMIVTTMAREESWRVGEEAEQRQRPGPSMTKRNARYYETQQQRYNCGARHFRKLKPGSIDLFY